uniref:SFRICE_026127 n=1 Tax=Spodoptera frugiperda TaxID=7108 RepID=A0A2H1X2F7_SPOFR
MNKKEPPETFPTNIKPWKSVRAFWSYNVRKENPTYFSYVTIIKIRVNKVNCILDQNTAENILSYVTLQVIDNADCEPLVVTPENICTSGIGPVGHIGICSGDSGGPLITLDFNGNPILIGITSFRSRAKGCEGGAPSGFTRVTSFMDFIISNLDTR